MFSDFWADMWTPEQAKGWEWSALFGGHVFVGVVFASALLAFTNLNPYVIDAIAFLGYLLTKEALDYIRSRDWRDGLVDALGVGFGSYILTSVALDNFEAAFLVGFMASVVAVYGYIHTRGRHE